MAKSRLRERLQTLGEWVFLAALIGGGFLLAEISSRTWLDAVVGELPSNHETDVYVLVALLPVTLFVALLGAPTLRVGRLLAAASVIGATAAVLGLIRIGALDWALDRLPHVPIVTAVLLAGVSMAVANRLGRSNRSRTANRW